MKKKGQYYVTIFKKKQWDRKSVSLDSNLLKSNERENKAPPHFEIRH